MKRLIATLIFCLPFAPALANDTKPSVMTIETTVAAPAVQIQLTIDKPEIFVGEVAPVVTVKRTNIGTTNLKLIDLKQWAFKNQWVVDNRRISFMPTGCEGVGCPTQGGEHILKPGESYEDKLHLYIHESTERFQKVVPGLPEPIIFKFGFKETKDSEIVWSNSLTIAFKKNEDMPAKIVASLITDTINITDQKTAFAEANLKITNAGLAPIDVGRIGLCGLHELAHLLSDNEVILIDTGTGNCPDYRPTEDSTHPIILKPGEIWEQKFKIGYFDENANPSPLTFRVGLHTVGHDVVWSNPLAVKLIGANAAYMQTIAAIKNMVRNSENQPNQFSTGIFKSYYPSGALSEEKTYEFGDLNGPDKKYYEDGKIRWIKIYKDNISIHETYYSQNGKLVAEMASYNGKDMATTSEIHYDENDNVIIHTAFIHGVACSEDDNPATERLRIKDSCNDLRAQLKPGDPALKILTPSASTPH